MTHDEFKVYIKNLCGIEITELNKSKVYLNFVIPGGTTLTELPKDTNFPFSLAVSLTADWKNEQGESFKDCLEKRAMIKCVKMIREHLDLGLKEAKDLYEKYENDWRSYISL